MFDSKNKIQLSPRLKLGVGRAYSQNHIFKFAAIICLFIAFGLSLHAIWVVFSPDKSSITENSEPQVLGAFDSNSDMENSNLEFIEYKVKKGDTLFNLSQNFNINWSTLAVLNNLKSPFLLKPGQTLKIPKN